MIGWAASRRSLLGVIDVHQAEAVALGVGDDDEVRIRWSVNPVDQLSAEILNKLGRRLLIVDTMDGDVQVHARTRLHRRCAQLKGEHRAASIAVFEGAPARAAVLFGRPKVEQCTPEPDSTVKIVDA